MGPINLFVFAIFKSAELVRRNCLKPSSDEVADQGNLQENRSRQGGTLQDIPPANEGNLHDGRGSWSEAQKHLGVSQGTKKEPREGREVYDNRVFSTNE